MTGTMMTRRWIWRSLAVLGLLLGASTVHAEGEQPGELLDTARFEQRLNAQVPADLVFRDEQGAVVTLGDVTRQKPAILVMAYYNCPNLCNVVIDDLVENLREISFVVGKEFDVVTVSIDPRERPVLAAEKKTTFLDHYGRSDVAEGWHALTGEQPQIDRLADVIGFRYAYDKQLQQYAHPSGLVILTPQGKVSSYLYGLVYRPNDLRLALVEASAGKIGTPLDQVMLRCYQFDPVSGKYTFAIMNIVRAVGFITFSSLALFMFTASYRGRRSQISNDSLQEVR
jgi:protein SCO1/2